MAPAKSSTVWAVTRTDYVDRSDAEGHQILVAICASEDAAKDAVTKHVDAHLMSYDMDEDAKNVKDSSKSKGFVHQTYMINHDDYHSFDIEVSSEELIGGTVNVTATKAKPAAASKAAASNGGKAGSKPESKAGSKRKAATPPEEDEAAADDDDDEEDEEEVKPTKPAKAAKVAKPKVPEVEAPTGKPNCLSGLTFIITGTLEGFDRKEAQALIEDYGGKMESSLKKTIDYVVLGVKAGPKKLEQIKEWELKTINQEGLYDLIKSRPEGDAPAEKRASKRGKKA